MKRFAVSLSLVGLIALSRSAHGQAVEFVVAPQNAACGDTIDVAPGASIDIPLNLGITSDADVSGFTMSLRVKPDPALVIEPSDLTDQRTVQFADVSKVSGAAYSALHFAEPCCAQIGSPPERGEIPAPLRGQEVQTAFPFPADPDRVPTQGPLAGSPQGPGYTLAIVYRIGTNPIVGAFAIVLPPGENVIVENNVFIRVTAPASAGEFPIEFVYEDGLAGGGQSVSNIATINQASVPPTLGSCTVTLRTGDEPVEPVVDLAVETPAEPIEVPAGEKGSATVHVLMDNQIAAGQRGVEGWQLSLSYSDTIDVVSAATSQEVLDAIPDADSLDFDVLEFSVFDSESSEWMGVDPTLVFEPSFPPDPDCELTEGEPQGKGLVQGVVITQTPDPELDQDINDFQGRMVTLEVELAEPIGAEETVTADFEWRDCLEGSGIPIKSVFTVGGESVKPRNRTGGTITFEGLPAQVTLFNRGDANQDGVDAGDVADAFFVLEYLFFADSEPIECLDAADANDDEKINISDPINMIIAEFRGGTIPPPHGECGTDDDQTDESCVSFDPEACP